MIFKEYRNFFNLQECNKLIERFRQQVCFHERYRDTIVLKLLNQTFPKLTDVLKKDFNILLNYGQIVYWPPFSHMDCHYDFTIENKDVFTSICYLNDDFEGGEFDLEIYKPGEQQRYVTIHPKVNSAVFFLADQWHRVRPVTAGHRKSLVAWFYGPPYA